MYANQSCPQNSRNLWEIQKVLPRAFPKCGKRLATCGKRFTRSKPFPFFASTEKYGKRILVSRGMKIRLVAFVLAIAVMVVSIVWTAQLSWRRTGELRDRLTSVQTESFRIADHFQHSILELDSLMLKFGLSHNSNDWNKFAVKSDALDKWIDEQRPFLPTEKEKLVLDEINSTYDFYMASAKAIGTNVASNQEVQTRLSDIADFETQSQRIMGQGFKLAGAHRQSVDSFLAASNKSLAHLRVLLLSSFALLLLGVAGLAVVVYRDLIAPLRVKLVESQALMERQEKLASLGMLAAGVAHEIRNPLTAIKAWLFIQQKHLQPATPEYEDGQVISNEITRLERIVKDVLLFARPSEPHLTSVPADEPLREILTLLAPDLEKSRIRLQLDGAVSAPIRIDPAQIKQVLINLIKNAADSIGADGVITLRAREDTRRLSDHANGMVILEVADTGKGIAPEVQKRLFDPFFTTKETGTGLGLSIAARIVEKHGGALLYQTQVNHGSVFGIVLPRV
jgi:signal transduction histidine kinase